MAIDILTVSDGRLVVAGGVSMLLVLAAGCDGGSAAPAGHGSSSGSAGAAQTLGVLSSPSISSTPPRTDADNLRAAALESERTVRLAPLPRGARRIPGKPRGWPPLAGFGISPSNSTLTRTAWYAVPLSADSVQRFLLHHCPRGMSGKGEGVALSTGVRSYRYRTLQPRDPAPNWMLIPSG